MSKALTPFEIRFLMKINDMGIISFCSNATEFREALASLPPGERREVKRKFRKAWRKLAKKDQSVWGQSQFFPKKEKESGKPSRRTRRNRQMRVLRDVNDEVRKDMREKKPLKRKG